MVPDNHGIPTIFLKENIVDRFWRTTQRPSSLIFGLVFGVALGPCTFDFMAPVLGITFGIGVLALFGLGHCAVIGFAGFSSTWVQRWLDWQDGTPGAKWLRRLCGVLVIAAGVWLVATSH